MLFCTMSIRPKVVRATSTAAARLLLVEHVGDDWDRPPAGFGDGCGGAPAASPSRSTTTTFAPSPAKVVAQVKPIALHAVRAVAGVAAAEHDRRPSRETAVTRHGTNVGPQLIRVDAERLAVQSPIMPTVAMELSRSQRLDRLPLTAAHRRLLAGSGVGWALDAMDVGLVSFILAALAVQWSLSPGQLSAIASIGFVGMAVGAGLGGLLADRVGRRSVFALTLLIYGLATGASALATGVSMLLVLRFITGLGLGAELPVASTLVSEYAPARIRGRLVVILESFWAVGWVGAALIGYFVVPSSANGWRWAFAIGMVPAAYAIVVRWKLPESVRFLERRGRTAEAEAAVRRFEASAGVDPLPSPDHPPATDVRAQPWATVDAEVPGAHDCRLILRT